MEALAYFDIFDFPLTAQELCRFAWKSSLSPRTIPQLAAYHFLPGREQTVHTRSRAVRHVDAKLRIAVLACRKLRWIPFLKAVFVGNTVATGTATSASDIDVFIVVRSGRIWLTRLLVTVVLSVFRLRRTKRHVANRVCLSFYVADNALNLRPIAIHGEDVYLMHWIHELIPVYDPENTYEKILAANAWTDACLPHARQPFIAAPRIRVADSRLSRACRRMLERLWGGAYGDLIETQAKIIQRARMDRNTKSGEKIGANHVVISDAMMKFHEQDRREEFWNEWKKRRIAYA